MLWTPVNDFNWTVDNFGATYSNAAFGVQVQTANAANTKGSDTEILSDSSVTEDVYGVALFFCGGASSATIRNYLVDIKTDPTGGTTWGTVISNLMVNSPHFDISTCGYSYYFPLFMTAGTAIAAAVQSNQISTTNIRVGIKLFGKPSYPHLCKVGSKVESFGANASDSGGVSITAGAQAMGSYTASLGTTAGDLWWWQAGICSQDTTLSNAALLLEVAAGDGSNKVPCATDIQYITNNSEQAYKSAMGLNIPYRRIKAGSDVYMRAACNTSPVPDGPYEVAAYGLGG